MRKFIFTILFLIPLLFSCSTKKDSPFSGIVIWTVTDEINYDLLKIESYSELSSKYNDSIFFDFKECDYYDVENHSFKFKDNKWENKFLENYLKGYKSGKGNIYFSIVLNNEMYTSGLCRIFNISENFYPLDAAGTLYLLYSKEAELLKISYDINDDGTFEDYVSSEELFPFVLDYKPIEQVLESNKKSKNKTAKIISENKDGLEDSAKDSVISNMELKNPKKDVNGNEVLNYKNWHPNDTETGMKVQFSGVLGLLNLTVKDSEFEAIAKLVEENIVFENVNYLDDGLRTYKSEGLFGEDSIFTIGYYDSEFAMFQIENLSFQECQNIIERLTFKCDISILDDGEFYKFVSDSYEIYFSYSNSKYQFEIFDTAKSP